MTLSAVSLTRGHVSRWLLAALLLSAASPLAWADPVGPSAADRQITLAVTSLVRREHLTRHPLDNEISERSLKTLLKALDPMKVYFYQSDIDDFTKHKDELCDQLRKGDVGFAYTVFRTFLQRVDERVKWVDELLAMQHVCTVDEQMAIDRDQS